MEESQQGILIWCSCNEWTYVLAAVLIQLTLQGKPQGRWQDRTRKCGSWTPANPKREGEGLRGPRWSIMIRAMHSQRKRQRWSMGSKEQSWQWEARRMDAEAEELGEARAPNGAGSKHHSAKPDERPCNRWYRTWGGHDVGLTRYCIFSFNAVKFNKWSLFFSSLKNILSTLWIRCSGEMWPECVK